MKRGHLTECRVDHLGYFVSVSVVVITRLDIKCLAMKCSRRSTFFVNVFTGCDLDHELCVSLHTTRTIYCTEKYTHIYLSK